MCGQQLPPLVKAGPITDLFAEGVERVEIFGDNARVLYWKWELDEGLWQRVALEFSIIRPLHSFGSLRGLNVVRPPAPSTMILMQ